MRFMVMAKATADTEAGVIPATEDFAAMLAYQEELLRAGVLVDRGTASSRAPPASACGSRATSGP